MAIKFHRKGKALAIYEQPIFEKSILPTTEHSEQLVQRLCSVYTHDILQFLSRKEVVLLQQVSSAMDTTVMGANISQLPRHVQLSFLALESVGLLLF